MKLFGKETSITDLAVLAGATGTGIYFLNKWAIEKRLKEFNAKFGSSIEAQQASAIYAALNPSGIEWLRKLDGTNVKALFAAVSQIKNWAKVSEYYSTLTGGNRIVQDVQSELSSSEYQQFTDIINKVPGSLPGRSGNFKFKVGDTLYLKEKAPIPHHDVNNKFIGNWAIDKDYEFKVTALNNVYHSSGINYYVSSFYDSKGVFYKRFFPEDLVYQKSWWNIFGISGLGKSEPGIGKIEDAYTTTSVPGGRIDKHWGNIEPDLKFFRISKDQYSNQFKSQSFIKDLYGLKSIEFGNWVNQQERINHLAGIGTALQCMAEIFKVKPAQIGFGNILSIAVGARGVNGVAAAHYEPFLKRYIINLTKTKGAGALVHEYAHFLDNFIGLNGGEKTKDLYMSGGRRTDFDIDNNLANKKTFSGLFEKLYLNLYYTDPSKQKFTKFAEFIKDEKAYWKRRNEVFARTFEIYTLLKLKSAGLKSFYLVDGVIHTAYPDNKLVKLVTPIIDQIVSRAFAILQAVKTTGPATVNGIGKPSITSNYKIR
jgi:hypothetical protein